VNLAGGTLTATSRPSFVSRAVDLAHPAGADQSLDPIRTDHPAGFERRPAGGRYVPVHRVDLGRMRREHCVNLRAERWIVNTGVVEIPHARGRLAGQRDC
jgi:hypothetical protein